MAPHCPNKNTGNCSSVPQPTNSGLFRQNRSTEQCKCANSWLVCRLRGVTRSSEGQACAQPALHRVSCTFSSSTSGKFYTDRPASHCSSSLHSHPSQTGWLSSSGSREKTFPHQSRCRRSLFSLILLALMLGLASTVSSSVSGLNAETIWPYPLSQSPSPPLIPLHSTPTLVHHLKQQISSLTPAALALPPTRTSKMSLQSTSTKSGSFESVALAPPLGSALTKPDQTNAVFNSLAVHLPIGPKHSTHHDLSRPTKNSQTWPRSHFVLGSTLQQANLQQLFNSSDNQTTFQPTGSLITSNSRTPATTAAPFLQLHRPTRQGRRLTKRQTKLDSLLGQLMINHDRYLRSARESNQKRSTIIRRTAMPMFSKRSSWHEAWPGKSSFSTPSTARLLNRLRRSQHQKSVSQQQQQQQLAQHQQFSESWPLSSVESRYLSNGPHHFHSLPDSMSLSHVSTYLSPIEDHSKIVRQFRSPQPDQVPMFMSVKGLESVESQQQSQQSQQQYQLPHYNIVPKSLEHQYRLFPQFNRYPRFVTSFMHSAAAYSHDSDAIHDRFGWAPSSRVHAKELQEQEVEEDEMPATDALSLYRSINRNPHRNYNYPFGYNQNKGQEQSEKKDKTPSSSLHHHPTPQSSDYQTRGFSVKRQKNTILTLDPILNNQQQQQQQKRKSGEIIHKERDVNQDNRKQQQPSSSSSLSLLSVDSSGDNQSNTLLSNGNDDGAGNGNEMNIGIAPSMLNGARPNNNNNSNSQSNRVLNNNRSDNRNNYYPYYYNHHQNYFDNNNNNNSNSNKTTKKHPKQPINDGLNGRYAGYYSRYGSNGPGAGYQSGNRNSRNDHYEHFDNQFDNHFNNDNGNSHNYFNQNQQEQAKIYAAAAIAEAAAAAAAADARSNDSATNRGLSGAIRWRNRLALVANLFDRHRTVQQKRYVPSFRSNQTARSGGVVPWSWWWWKPVVSNSSHQPYQPNKSDLISSASYLRSPFRLSTFPPPLSDFPIDPTLDFNFETQTQKRSSYYRPSIEPKVGISQSGTVHLRRAGSRNFDNYYYGNRSHNPNLANSNNNNSKSRTRAKQGQYSRAQPYRSSHNYYQSSSRSSSSSSSKQQKSPPYEFGIGRSELQRAQQSKIISPSRVQSSRLGENRYWKSQSKSSKPSQNRENLTRFGDKPRPNKQPTSTVSQTTRPRYGSSETIDQGIVRVSAANNKPVSHNNGLSRDSAAASSSVNSFPTNKQSSSSSSSSWSTSPKHHTSFVAIPSYSDKQPKQSDAQQVPKTGFSSSIAANRNGGDERGTKDKPAPVYGQYASNYSESNNSPKMRGSRNANGKPLYDVAQIECPISENGMERFACPSADSNGRYLCIDDQHICNGYSDCPKGEDEDSMSCMFYRSTKAHLDVLADYLLQWARGRHSK